MLTCPDERLLETYSPGLRHLLPTQGWPHAAGHRRGVTFSSRGAFSRTDGGSVFTSPRLHLRANQAGPQSEVIHTHTHTPGLRLYQLPRLPALLSTCIYVHGTQCWFSYQRENPAEMSSCSNPVLLLYTHDKTQKWPSPYTLSIPRSHVYT